MKEGSEHLVASKRRWDDWQRQRKAQEEKAWKESPRHEEEDKRKRFAAFEEAAKEMLKYLEDSEELKVGLSELKEQLETPEQARKEGGQKLSEIFRQGENEVYIASMARWDTQSKGLVELERRCQDLTQEVQFSSKRQEVLVGMVVSKRDMQKETQKVSREHFPGIQGVRGAKEKKPGTRAKQAYARKVGRRKGKSENARRLG